LPLIPFAIESVRDSGLPVRTIAELKDEAEKICGKPSKPEFESDIVAAVKWVDGTVIDVVRKIKR
jgi:citrate lyase subunit alpha/citrate CoA-transferase